HATFFFFQAEDGIRDFHVTGVQTCALPIYSIAQYWATRRKQFAVISRTKIIQSSAAGSFQVVAGVLSPSPWGLIFGNLIQNALRSEERRVGKECSSRW